MFKDTEHFSSRGVAVLTLPHRHNTMQSVVAGQVRISLEQAPLTLEWKATSEKKKKKKSHLIDN